jgi:hypothetical protein
MGRSADVRRVQVETPARRPPAPVKVNTQKLLGEEWFARRPKDVHG